MSTPETEPQDPILGAFTRNNRLNNMSRDERVAFKQREHENRFGSTADHPLFASMVGRAPEPTQAPAPTPKKQKTEDDWVATFEKASPETREKLQNALIRAEHGYQYADTYGDDAFAYVPDDDDEFAYVPGEDAD